jgi:UMP-CMP kinase
MLQASSNRFLIDGFPRALDQGLTFESQVCKSSFILFFDCSEEEMLGRLLKRAETSGRVDDNEDSIRKRFKTFRETSYPVVEYYEKLGKVKKVNCSRSIEEVYLDTTQIINEFFKN